MKSFYGFMVGVFLTLLIFTGMNVVTDNLHNNNILTEDSEVYVQTLNKNLENISVSEFDVEDPEVVATSSGDSLTKEFDSATTDSKKKGNILEKIKDVPAIIRFAVGNEDDFNWAWGIATWFLGVLAALVLFVIIFRKDIFGGNQ